MAFIPTDARWYLADIILELRIVGDSRNLVQVNTHLVEAGSPEEAYDKAQTLGRSGEEIYENTDGKAVKILFRGLRGLSVIHEPLEDSAEIMYSADIGVSEEQLEKWSTPRKRLGVFRPIESQSGPNTMPAVFGPLLDCVEDDGDKESLN